MRRITKSEHVMETAATAPTKTDVQRLMKKYNNAKQLYNKANRAVKLLKKSGVTNPNVLDPYLEQLKKALQDKVTARQDLVKNELLLKTCAHHNALM